MCQQSLWRTDDDQTEVYDAGGGARSNDVAKHRNEVLIEAVRGGRRRRMTILNTRADHDKLITSLQAMQKPIVVGLEPTGNYHRVLAHRLIEAGFGVRLISSMALARTREALHNGWDKNDPKDAQVILHMLGIGCHDGLSGPACCWN